MGKVPNAGRKRTPTNVLKKQGTFRPDRHGKDQIVLVPEEANPDPPEWLDELGKEEWRRIHRVMQGYEIFTSADLAPVAAYCDAVSQYIQACEAMKNEPRIYEEILPSGITKRIANPNFSLREKAAAQIKSFACEYGLTAAARTRINAIKKANQETDEEDLLT